MRLVELLVTLLGWKVRLVGQRPRRVTRAQVLRDDSRAQVLAPNINALLNSVTAGEDLTPYLSLSAGSEGFTIPDKSHPKGLWADKDFLLNAMGFHHFHLGLMMEPAGHYKRTNEVLFALVSRDEFEVVGLFTHDVFDRDDKVNMTDERQRLWSAFKRRSAEGVLPGQMYIGGMAGMGISGSGMPIAVIETAFHYIRQIEWYENELRSFEFAKTLYSEGNIQARSKFKWSIDHLDLVLLGEGAGQLVRIAKGLN